MQVVKMTKKISVIKVVVLSIVILFIVSGFSIITFGSSATGHNGISTPEINISSTRIFHTNDSNKSIQDFLNNKDPFDTSSGVLVTFNETGIPNSDLHWGVTLNGIFESSYAGYYGGDIQFYMMPGTYHYNVSPLYGFTIYPSSGNITVSSTPVVIGITFTQTLQTVTFTETGLPYGQDVPNYSDLYSNILWGVTLNDVFESSQEGAIEFLVTPGIYHFNVSGLHGFTAYPSSGNITISSKPVNIGIVFTEKAQTVHFVVNGYTPTFPLDLEVSINGVVTGGLGPSYLLMPGTYSYNIYYAGNYTLSPTSGIIVVGQSTINLNITATVSNQYYSDLPTTKTLLIFSEISQSNQLTYQATNYAVPIYSEVIINNVIFPFNYNILGPLIPLSLSVNLLNGTYNVNFLNTPGAEVIPSSTLITINGTTNVDLDVSANFVGSILTVNLANFPEENVEFILNGIVFSYWYEGPYSGSYGTVLGTIGLNNGTYSFTVLNIPGYELMPSEGNITIDGYNELLNIEAVPDEFSINFIESGLPPNPFGVNLLVPWSVSLNGSIETSQSNTITFEELNGTYYFYIQHISNYTATPIYGEIIVNGKNINQTITFTQVTYTVTFTESGLPSGTSWSGTLNGATESSSTDTITFQVPNGTYQYTINNISGYSVSPSSGSIVVNGKNFDQVVTFTPTTTSINKYAITFTESGLPSGTSWSIVLNGTSISSTGPITFNEPNGTYTFTVSTVSGYKASPASGTVIVSGNSVSSSIDWNIVTYPMTITETGISPGASWSVTLTGTTFTGQQVNVTLSSTTDSITFSEPNGTYTYSVNLPSGYTGTNLSGSFKPTGQLVTTNITVHPATDYTLIIIVVLIVIIAVTATIVVMMRRGQKK